MKLLRIIRDWLRFEILGGNLAAILEAVRTNGAYLRQLVVEVNSLRATTTNLTVIANATGVITKGLKRSMSTQEQLLQEHRDLLKNTIVPGVGEILRRLAAIPPVLENKDINDEIDEIKKLGKDLAVTITTALNPPVATGAPVTSATGEELPVNRGNEHLIIGGTTSSTPTLAQPGAQTSAPTSAGSAPTTDPAQEQSSAPVEVNAPAQSAPAQEQSSAPVEATSNVAAGVIVEDVDRIPDNAATAVSENAAPAAVTSEALGT